MAEVDLHRILLIDSQPYQHRELVLKAGNFLVTTVPSLTAARATFIPQHFSLVLIVTDGLDGDPVQFCEHLKQLDSTQTVALLSGPHVYLPQDSCPDDVIHKIDGPRHLLKRVNALIKSEPQAQFAD
jgi:DNA-binding response OmpR family regulator